MYVQMDITEQRIKHGWSKAELARRIGVSQLTIRRWEQGKVKPSMMAQKHLERVFKVKID